MAERWLNIFVRALVNQRATRDIHVSVAVGLTEYFGVAFRRKLTLISSAVHWQPRLLIRWLQQNDVEKLLQSARKSKGDSNRNEPCADQIFAAFKGQPYLTHAAIMDKHFLEIVQAWSHDPVPAKSEPIRNSTWYRKHLGAIRLAILGPTYEPNTEARRMLQSFVEACASAQTTSNADHQLFLETARLLDASGNPTLEIYRLMAEDLLAMC